MAESFNAKIKLFRANLREGWLIRNFFSSELPTYMLIPTKFLLNLYLHLLLHLER